MRHFFSSTLKMYEGDRKKANSVSEAMSFQKGLDMKPVSIRTPNAIRRERQKTLLSISAPEVTKAERYFYDYTKKRSDKGACR